MNFFRTLATLAQMYGYTLEMQPINPIKRRTAAIYHVNKEGV
jgi:hypothetical protein